MGDHYLAERLNSDYYGFHLGQESFRFKFGVEKAFCGKGWVEFGPKLSSSSKQR